MPADRILGLNTPTIAPGTHPSLFGSAVQQDLLTIALAAWHVGETPPAGAQEDDKWYQPSTARFMRLKSGLWIADLALSARTRVVSPNKGGHYTSLVAALADITDAALGNEYVLLVQGELAETAAVVAKPYVHLIGLGHPKVTVTLANTNGRFQVNCGNAVWKGLRLHSAGAAGGTNYCLEMQASSDRTFKLWDCRVKNDSADAASIALKLIGSPWLLDSFFEGGGDGTVGNCHGAFAQGTSNPLVQGCRFRGKAINGKGVWLNAAASGQWEDCDFEVEDGCTGTGGSTNPAALMIQDACSPVIVHCRANGGAATSGNTYGVRVDGSASPRFEHVVSNPGTTPDGNFSLPWYFLGASAAELVECATDLPKGAVQWAYNSANSGRFQPNAAGAFQVASLSVAVTVAHAATTLNIGTTAGGSDVASGISLAATGTIGVALPDTAYAVLAAGAYLYATPSAGITNGDVTVNVGWVSAQAKLHGIYNTSTGRVRVRGGTYQSSAASHAVVFNGDANVDQFMVEGAVLAARQVYPYGSQQNAVHSLSQTSPLKDAQVYGCSLRGGVGNTTLALGRKQGSNLSVGLYLPNRGAEDWLTQPPNWDYGLLTALMNAGATPARILALTDSLGQGFSVPSVTDWALNGYIGQLATALWARFGQAGEYEPTANSTSFQSTYAGRQYWTAFAASAAWNVWGLGRAPTWAATGVDLVTFTYPYDVLSSRFFYVDNTAGTWTYQIGAAGAVTVTNTDSKAVKFIDLGAQSAGTVVVFGHQSITQCFAPNGMHLRKQATGVELYRATYTGASAGEWFRTQYYPANKAVLWQGNTALAAPYNAGNLGPPTQPHVAIIELGLNDANTQLSTAPTGGLYRFQRGLQRLCAAFRRGYADCSIVIVAAPSPDKDSSDLVLTTNFYGSDGTWPYYVETMAKVAHEFGALFVNLHAAVGETPVADLKYGGTSIHPNQAGHDWAYQKLARAILPR